MIENIIDRKKFKKYSEKSSLPLYIALKEYLKRRIEKHEILQGTKMLSSRNMSELLDVSRSTVIKSYELLVFEGIILARKGSGHEVLPRTPKMVNSKQKIDPKIRYTEISHAGKSFLANVHIMNTSSEGSIAFRPGLPPLDIFPIHQWKKLFNQYWRNIKASSLTYSNVSGVSQLKRSIAEYLFVMRGIKCDDEQVIIVSGSVQSLFLTGSALVNEGDKVVMENPTFPNVHSIFKSLNADLQAIELDQEGIDIKKLHQIATPKIIHVTPSNHYPTGVKMSLQRKSALLKFAKQAGAIIIENDYDHEISNWGLKEPSIFELDKDQRTVFLGTFNRLLHPSIRLGYMVVPYYLLDVVKALQKHSHRFVSPSNQVVMSEFIKKNYLFNHIKNVVEIAEEREEIFKNLLRENMHESFQIMPSPAKSLHLLAKISDSLSDTDITETFEQEQILVHPYSKCFVHQPKHGLILGHTAVRKHLMQQKITEMARLYNLMVDKQ